MSKHDIDDYELIECMEQYVKDFSHYAIAVSKMSTFLYVTKKDFNIIKSAVTLLEDKLKDMEYVNPDKIRKNYKVKKIIKHGKRRGLKLEKVKENKSFKVRGVD